MNLLILPIQTAMGTYFYETGRNEVVAVNRKLYDYIKRVCAEGESTAIEADDETKKQYRELQECGYLQPCKVKEVMHPATQQLTNLLSRGVDKLTLQVTQGCNLRCKYCIYSENSNLDQRSHSSNAMSIETAKKSIDFYRQHSIDAERAMIGFYGGEPLLAFHTVAESVKYAKSIFQGRDISFGITTNGTLLTDEMIEFLIEYNFAVTFSLDGPKRVHNRNRVFRDGGGSFDIVLSNIKKMYERDPNKLKNASVSMVIDPTQDYQELLELFCKPSLRDINLIFSMVEENSSTKKPSEKYSTEFNYDNFLALVDYFRGNTEAYSSPFMTSSIQSFEQDTLKVKESVCSSISAPGGPCIPGKLKLFIDCFGNLYPCEKVDENIGLCIGTVEEGYDLEKVAELLNVGQLDAESCKKCWAFPLCSICAKRACQGGKLSAARRSEFCVSSRNYAHNIIMDKILTYEDRQHKRVISKVVGG